MKKEYYQIAGHILEISWEKEQRIPIFQDFHAERSEQELIPELRVQIYEGEKLFQQWYGVDYCCMGTDYPHRFCSHQLPQVRMSANRDYSHMVVEGCAGKNQNSIMEVLMAGFYSWLSACGGLLFHASLVEYEGNGLLFTAASGVGKTTQAELWEKYRKAQILNGDKVILTSNGGSVLAWGSPWRGSSPYAVNQSAPLKAIIVIEQAAHNRIRQLRNTEAVRAVSQHIFYPSWDAACAEAVLETYDFVMSRVPVFLLSCRPDEEAVEKVYEKVFPDGAVRL